MLVLLSHKYVWEKNWMNKQILVLIPMQITMEEKVQPKEKKTTQTN